jgi:hypothetical protein
MIFRQLQFEVLQQQLLQFFQSEIASEVNLTLMQQQPSSWAPFYQLSREKDVFRV